MNYQSKSSEHYPFKDQATKHRFRGGSITSSDLTHVLFNLSLTAYHHQGWHLSKRTGRKFYVPALATAWSKGAHLVKYTPGITLIPQDRYDLKACQTLVDIANHLGVQYQHCTHKGKDYFTFKGLCYEETKEGAEMQTEYTATDTSCQAGS